MNNMSSIQHFSHTHLLTKKFNNVDDFICDGCGIKGSGRKYRCEPCDYDLHEDCATCPITLPAIFLHPQHDLRLWFLDRKKLSTVENTGVCDICNGSVEGLLYRCKICDFDVHLICSQIPQYVKHDIHPAHNLEFQLHCLGTTACEVCHDPCRPLTYGCELCKLNIHVQCFGNENTWKRLPDETEASSSRPDGNDICKDCGSKESVKRNQCKVCRELKWERRNKRAEGAKKVLELVMGFLG